MKVHIVGAGLGKTEYLTQYAKSTIETADLVITTQRIYDNLKFLNENTLCLEISKTVPFINENLNNFKNICVLASGDIGFFSIAKTLKNTLPKECELEFISGISSLQALTAKLGTSYDDVKFLSAHGRSSSLIAHICYNKKVFLLTGGERKAHDLIKELVEAGLGDVTITVGENLAEITERIFTKKAKDFGDLTFENLTVMLVENDNFVEHFAKISDEDFIRGKSPMTKHAVRVLSIDALDIKPYENIVDIGAGTGSVTVAMARKAYEGSVTAIERNFDAISLIKENIAKFGAYNITVKNTLAPEGLIGNFDKAFIGGSSGNLKEIIDTLLTKNNCKKIVVNAITLETLNEAINAFKENNMKTVIFCVNVAVAEKISSYNMMKAQNPIYILCGEKNENN